MQIGTKQFQFDGHHVYVMGILNVTPDSFSDGGKFNHLDQALAHVEEMVAQGADIIDIGGESTRPGYQKITVEEEIERVTEVIRKVKERFDVPVSLDTYKAPVMAEIVAKHHKPVCIMHNRPKAEYEHFLIDMKKDLQRSLMLADAAGIARDQIILDPGVGFGKTYEQNLAVLAHLDTFLDFELPLLLATSRKSVIGLTLDLPVEEREEGTMVTSVLAALNHWDMVRVHDVEKNVRALRMTEKIMSLQ